MDYKKKYLKYKTKYLTLKKLHGGTRFPTEDQLKLDKLINEEIDDKTYISGCSFTYSSYPIGNDLTKFFIISN